MNAPAILFVAGDVEILRGAARVSIVRARHPTPEGRRRAARLAGALVERGVTVVSGLAEGIDTEAHWAAIGSGGKTIAVLATPLDESYPRQNEALQRLIVDQHLGLVAVPARPVRHQGELQRDALARSGPAPFPAGHPGRESRGVPLGVGLMLPEDLERLALGVVVEAGETHEMGVARPLG